jgi:hypothetical protein
MVSTQWSTINLDCAGAIAARNTLLFFNFEEFASTDPKQGLLQQTHRQMATSAFGLPLPAQRTALDVPEQVFIIPFQADLLIGIFVEKGRKGFTARLKFRLQRQEPEGQIGQAKFRAELAQSIFETGTAYAQGQTTAGSGTVSALQASLQMTDIRKRKSKILVIRRVIIYIYRQICKIKHSIYPGMPKYFFHRKEYDPSHPVGIEILFLVWIGRRVSVISHDNSANSVWHFYGFHWVCTIITELIFPCPEIL